MELVIPGLILVGLMIYASTRIKKRAAQAFEHEQIFTEDFSITKPEGFLHVLNGRTDFAFEAYSKDFGQQNGAEHLRQSVARIQIFTDTTIDDAAESVKAGFAELISEDHFAIDRAPTRVIRGRSEQKGITTDVACKLIERDKKVFNLEILSLQEQIEAYACKIDTMLDSFQLN